MKNILEYYINMLSWIFGYNTNDSAVKQETFDEIKRRLSVKKIEKCYIDHVNRRKKKTIRAKKRNLYRRLTRTNPHLKTFLQGL